MPPAILAALRALFSRAAATTAARAGLSSFAPQAASRAVAVRAAQAEAGHAAAAEIKAFEKAQAAAAQYGTGSAQHSAALAAHTQAQTYSATAAAEHASQLAKGGHTFKDMFKEATDIKAKGAAGQLYSGAKGTAQNSPFGQLYSAAKSIAAPAPANVSPPAGNSTAYPWLTNQQVMGMAGQPQNVIQQANDEAERKAKQKAAEEQLLESTKKLTGAFSGMAKLAMKTTIAPLVAGYTVTKANEALVESQVERYKTYSTEHMRIYAERQIQDIQIDRRTAVATSGSAKTLNDAQMVGKEEYSKLTQDLTTLLNLVATGAQHLANGVAYLANLGLELNGMRSVVRAAEKWLGQGEGLDANRLLQAARDSQNELKGQKQLPPLKGVL